MESTGIKLAEIGGGQHVYLTAKIDGKLVVRPYTPVTSDADEGHMDLVIKVYFANVHPKFPEGGKMSQFVNGLEIGETIDVRGPNGLLIYEAPGRFLIRPSKKEDPHVVKASKLGLIAGGTGITPMLQMVRQVLTDPDDRSELWLLFANQTEQDILLREELEEAHRQFPERFRLHYTLDRPSDGWEYSSGFINETMLRDHMPEPGPDTLVLICGPPPMVDYAVKPNLDKLGHEAHRVFAY